MRYFLLLYFLLMHRRNVSGCFTMFTARTVCDQPDSPVQGKIRPNPFQKDTAPVSEAGQVEDMYKGPQQPCKKAAKLHSLDVGYGFGPGNGGHASFVGISEDRTVRSAGGVVAE